MPEMHLWQPGLHIVLVDHLQKSKEGTQKLKEQEIFISIFIKYIYKKKTRQSLFSTKHDKI